MILFALSLAMLTSPAPQVTDPRLDECLEIANTDPTTAIAQAGAWLGETYGSGTAAPQTCLGVAYTRLLRWAASADAFEAARIATPETDLAGRARLAAMAGNAALVIPDATRAANLLQLARAEALAAGETAIAGETAVDLARALIALERPEDAVAALQSARAEAPQFALAWLFSATLARRLGDLVQAQAFVENAVALDPDNPEIGLEAGVIAALAGREDAARQSFASVVAIAPGTEPAQRAQAYLDQLGE